MVTIQEQIHMFLVKAGAGPVRHRGRPLLEHLDGTGALLASWSCPEHVVRAGLCHAAYGTDGLIGPLVPLTERHALREIVGANAEEIVYQYGSCERQSVYPQLAVNDEIEFHDRFTGDRRQLPRRALTTFVELTWANAVEVAQATPGEDWSHLRDFFRMTQDLASAPARAHASALLDLDLAASP